MCVCIWIGQHVHYYYYTVPNSAESSIYMEWILLSSSGAFDLRHRYDTSIVRLIIGLEVTLPQSWIFQGFKFSWIGHSVSVCGLIFADSRIPKPHPLSLG